MVASGELIHDGANSMYMTFVQKQRTAASRSSAMTSSDLHEGGYRASCDLPDILPCASCVLFCARRSCASTCCLWRVCARGLKTECDQCSGRSAAALCAVIYCATALRTLALAVL